MTTKNQLVVIAVLLIVLAMLVFLMPLAADLPWCVENYAPSRLTHCLWYENSLWGRFVQPQGF